MRRPRDTDAEQGDQGQRQIADRAHTGIVQQRQSQTRPDGDHKVGEPEQMFGQIRAAARGTKQQRQGKEAGI